MRRLVPSQGARPTYQDVLGDLVHLDDRELAVDTRTGRVTVTRDDVASARLVRPAARDVLALEAVSARGWRAQEVETSSDGWLLRADRGWTGRANSALALRTVRRPLDDVLADVSDWYAARGLPARIQVPQVIGRGPGHEGSLGQDQSGPGQDQEGALGIALGRRGWVGADRTDVLVCRLDLLAARTGEAPGPDVHVSLDAAPDEQWLAAYHYRGRGPLPAGATELLTRHDRVVFARVELDGAVAAIGRGAVDDGWLGITAIDVVESRRRRGLASAVVRALAGWAASADAVRAYVQTDQANAAAHRMFAGLGFYRHHSYHYRSHLRLVPDQTDQPDTRGPT